ncbi:MAG: peptidylprolyl isomerase, partial [Christensenellaceae bacterium]
MFHTFHKAGKRVAGIGAAIVLGVSCFAMTGCETSRPQVSITVSFNEETYVLNYELYRNCYPQTVTHYLELANAGYYDGLCVHNYTSAMLYTGGYTYDENVKANGGLVEKNYFAIAPTLSLTQSVFDQATGEGTNTLYGEFTLNGYKVTNNAQRMKFGSLVMYYTEKTDDTVRVKTVRNDSKELNENMKYK